MDNLLFEKADESRLIEIYDIYTDVIRNMRNNGIEQWDESYPDKYCLQNDIEKGQLYIGICNRKIASAVVINEECDEQYINGKWVSPDASFWVIHRLCVNPLFLHRGIGKTTMQYIEKLAVEKRIKFIRLDTFTQNSNALTLYSNLGYREVGFAEWRKGRFVLMEKQLL